MNEDKGKEEMYPTDAEITFYKRSKRDAEMAKELGCIVTDNGDNIKIVYPTIFHNENIEITIVLYGKYPFHAPYVSVSNLVHPNIYPTNNVNTKIWSKNIDRNEWESQFKISAPGRLMYSNIIDNWSPVFLIPNLLQDILSILNDPEYEHVLDLNAFSN